MPWQTRHPVCPLCGLRHAARPTGEALREHRRALWRRPGYNSATVQPERQPGWSDVLYQLERIAQAVRS